MGAKHAWSQTQANQTPARAIPLDHSTASCDPRRYIPEAISPKSIQLSRVLPSASLRYELTLVTTASLMGTPAAPASDLRASG